MSDFYHDDPVEELSPQRKKPKVLFGSVLLLFAGGLFLNTTLAANINLNSGERVEFGQGASIFTACSEGTPLTVTPQSEFVNAAGAGAYYVKSIQVSGIPASCEGKDFNISLYDDVPDSDALPIFGTSKRVATIYNNYGFSQEGFQSTGSKVISTSGGFTVFFIPAAALSSNAMKVTLQSTEHQDEAIASISMNVRGSHTCTLLNSSAAKCWGDNYFGQVGDNTRFNQRETPVAVSVLGSGIRVIAPGKEHTCAVTGNGAAKCWGENDKGQLGNGTTTYSLTPVDVTGLSSGVATIVSGERHTCAVLRTGSVKCWGAAGRLGNGENTISSIPVDVTGINSAVAISAGWQHTCAVLSTGGLKCWGTGNRGALGNGSGGGSLIPVNVTGLSSGVIAVSTGDAHTCAVLNTGSVKCWGWNDNRQVKPTLGDQYTPIDIPGISSAVAIASGGGHNCVVLRTGAVKCWGNNSKGQLGDNSTTQRDAPVDVSGLSSAVAVSASMERTCALVSSGAIKCWGNNLYGQLGDGTTTNRLTPIDVIGIL